MVTSIAAWYRHVVGYSVLQKSSRTTLHYIIQMMVHVILSYPPGVCYSWVLGGSCTCYEKLGYWEAAVCVMNS